MLDRIKTLIIYNPKAGKGKTKKIMPEIKKMFIYSGITPMFYATKCKNDAYEIAKKFINKYYKEENNFLKEDAESSWFVERKHYLYVLAAGGDGTLNEVMRGVLDTGCDVPVGIIPAGSTNDFGYSLGINSGMMDAARKTLDAILADEAFKCDVMEFNSDDVTYTAAFGLFSDVSYATPQKLKNVFGHAAYIMYGAKNILKTRPVEVEIEYSEKEAVEENIKKKEKLLLGMVVSAKSVGGFRGITGAGTRLDDGKDELMFVRWPKNPLMLIKTLGHAVGMVRKSPEAQKKAEDLSVEYGIKIVKIRRARFDFAQPVSWAIDGEDGGEQKEVMIKVKKQAVSYLVL